MDIERQNAALQWRSRGTAMIHAVNPVLCFTYFTRYVADNDPHGAYNSA
jgi:hypothetical protein